MGNDDSRHAVLIVEVIIKLLQVGLAVVLFLDLLGVVIVIHGVGACLQLLQELIPKWRGEYLNSRGRCLGSVPLGPDVVPVGVGLALEAGLPAVMPGLVGFLLI